MSDPARDKVDWETTRERGVPFMLKLMIRSALLLGRTCVRPIVYGVVAYFMVTSAKGRQASRDFLRRVLGRTPTVRDVWRHFFAFASCAVDRIYILAGRNSALQITPHHAPEAIAATQRGKGCLLIVAHFGSFEVLRVMGNRRSLPIAILLDKQIGAKLTSLLEELSPNLASHIIDASHRGPDLVLRLKEVLESDRMVGMTADRLRLGDRSERVEFLGAQAQFPVSPWVLAGVLGVPVIAGFGVFSGGNRYDCYFELFAERVELPRAQRELALKKYAQDYAKRLEHYVRMAPYNWFNFYDFWQ